MVTEYKRQEKPRFKPGDRVVDSHGRGATVSHSYESRDWHSKSHRVEVIWDSGKIDNIAYYEEVFEPDDDPELH